MDKQKRKIFHFKDGEEAGETQVIELSFKEAENSFKTGNFSRSKWQSKTVFHPTFGPALCTKITDGGTATIEILSDDAKETLFKREVPLDELFYNYTFTNKMIFAFKTFFLILRRRTFVDHFAKGRDTRGKD